jgi:hypothetical protein
MILETQEPTRQTLINDRLTLRKEIVATLRIQRHQNTPSRRPISYMPGAFRDGLRVNNFLGRINKDGSTSLLTRGKFKTFDKVHMNFLNTHRRNPSYKDCYTSTEIAEILKENEVVLSWNDLYELKLLDLRSKLQLVVELLAS